MVTFSVYHRFSNIGGEKERHIIVILTIFLLAASILYAGATHKKYKEFFIKNSTLETSDLHAQPYVFIRENTGFGDVVFSPSIEVSTRNMAPLFYSAKQIYKILNVYDIYEKVRTIKQDYRINIVLKSDADPPPYIKRLMDAADEIIQRNPWRLIQLKKSSFINLFNEIRKGVSIDLYSQDKRRLYQAKTHLEKSILLNKHKDAIGFCDQFLSLIEKYDASRYYRRFYILKLAILINLERDVEADILLKRIRNIHFSHGDVFMWGWDPNPWSIGYILTALKKGDLGLRTLGKGV
jgi:hypothetical protein